MDHLKTLLRLSEHAFLRDLALLAREREALRRLQVSADTLRQKMTSEQGHGAPAANPEEAARLDRFLLSEAEKLRQKTAARNDLQKTEDAARAAALRAHGRREAINILIKRANADRVQKLARQAE